MSAAAGEISAFGQQSCCGLQTLGWRLHAFDSLSGGDYHWPGAEEAADRRSTAPGRFLLPGCSAQPLRDGRKVNSLSWHWPKYRQKETTAP